MAAAITLRTAALPDAERLLEIYRPYVEETAITFEYDVPTIDEFRGRMTRVLEKYPYLVAERDGTIVGYAYAGPFVGRAAYDRSGETTIYLGRAVRRAPHRRPPPRRRSGGGGTHRRGGERGA